MLPSPPVLAASILAFAATCVPMILSGVQAVLGQVVPDPTTAVPGLPGIPLRVPDWALAGLGLVALGGILATNIYVRIRTIRREQDIEDAKALAETWKVDKRETLAENRRLKENNAWQDRRIDALGKENERLQDEVERLYRERDQWIRQHRPHDPGPGSAPPT